MPRPRPKLPPDDPTTDYAKKVCAREIVAGPHVRDACARHLRDLEHGPKRGLVWDNKAAQRVFEFFEECLYLNGGEFEGQKFKLQPFQYFVLGNLFGWKVKDGTRRFRAAYIEAGKGSGKSPLVAGIGLYMLVADNEPRAEIFACATKRDQAQILFRDAVAMVKQSPELFAVLKLTGGPGHEWNIAHEASASFFRTIASDDSQSGPRPHCALIDEVHEHKSGLMTDMMRAGTKGRRQALILMITNSGTDRQSVCWTYHEYGIKLSAGSVEDDSFFAVICGLDQGDDPFTDESCWTKANPLLGVTIPPKYLQEQVREAKGMPSKESRVRRLNFCQWVDAANPWVPDHIWLAARDADYDEQMLLGRKCYGGLDLSSTLALTAYVLLFEPTETDPYWRQKCWFWLPEKNLEQLAKDYNLEHLHAWRASGWLETTPGGAVNKLHVLAKIVRSMERYKVMAIAYDRWRIEDLKVQMEDEGIRLPVESFGQGFKDMSPALETYETMLMDGRLKHDGNPVLTWNILSSVPDEDPAGNRKLTKARSTGLIDGAVASVMAAGMIGRASPLPKHQFFVLGLGNR